MTFAKRRRWSSCLDVTLVQTTDLDVTLVQTAFMDVTQTIEQERYTNALRGVAYARQSLSIRRRCASRVPPPF